MLFFIIPILILLFGVILLSWIIGIIRSVVYFIIEKFCNLFSIPYKRPTHNPTFKFYSNFGNKGFQNASQNQKYHNTKNYSSNKSTKEIKEKIFSKDEGEYVNFEEI